MTAIIVSGHGQLSTGLLDAFEMIFGHDEKIIAVPFLKGEGIPQLQEKYQVVMDQFPITFANDGSWVTSLIAIMWIMPI